MNTIKSETQRAKATFFCSSCGHESHIWDDWNVSRTSSVEITTCPSCGAKIDERPCEHTPRHQSNSEVAAPKDIFESVVGSIAAYPGSEQLTNLMEPPIENVQHSLQAFPKTDVTARVRSRLTPLVDSVNS